MALRIQNDRCPFVTGGNVSGSEVITFGWILCVIKSVLIFIGFVLLGKIERIIITKAIFFHIFFTNSIFTKVNPNRPYPLTLSLLTHSLSKLTKSSFSYFTH